MCTKLKAQWPYLWPDGGTKLKRKHCTVRIDVFNTYFKRKQSTSLKNVTPCRNHIYQTVAVSKY